MTTTIIDGEKQFVNDKYKINFIYPKGNTKQDDLGGKKLKSTIEEWKENGVEKYEGELCDLKAGMRICYITIEKKVRIGGYLRSNNCDDEYFTLFNSKNRASWSVQYKNVTGKSPIGVYIYTDAFEKWEELQEKKRIEMERKEGIKNGTIKRTRKSKNTPELLKAYEQVMQYYYYDQGYKKSRDYIHRFINDDFKRKIEDGSMVSFLKDVIKTDQIFNKIPRSEVEEFLNKQAIHQLTKKRQPVKEHTSFSSNAPLNLIQIDLLKLDNALLYNGIDIFTRKAFSLIIKEKTGKEIVYATSKLIKSLGKPKAIMSDNGSEFKNALFFAYLKKLEIKHVLSTPLTPTTQAYIERFNGTIKSDVNKEELTGDFINQSRLDKLVSNYNKTVHAKTKRAPDDAFREKAKVLENNNKHQSVNAQHRDDIKLGDIVRLQIEKDKIIESAIKWTEELFKISKILRPKKNPSNPILYKVVSIKDTHDNGEKFDNVIQGFLKRAELQVIKGGKVENVNKLKVVYEVDKFLKFKRVKGVPYLLVKWKGYPVAEATWKTITILRKEGFEDEVDEALKKLKKKLK